MDVGRSGLGKIYYAGYAWASVYTKVNAFSEPVLDERGYWNDATILIGVRKASDAEKIVSLPAYREFLNIAQNNAIAVVGNAFRDN